jgi:CBS-domain-containing membrane protein
MSTPIISAPPETTLANALEIMQSHRINHLVILTKDSQIRGLITRNEIIVKIERAAVEVANTFQKQDALCMMDPFSSISVFDKNTALACPHCQEIYKDKNSLSDHIKSTHAKTDN